MKAFFFFFFSLISAQFLVTIICIHIGSSYPSYTLNTEEKIKRNTARFVRSCGLVEFFYAAPRLILFFGEFSKFSKSR